MNSYKEMAEEYAGENCLCQDGGLSDAGCEIVAAGANCDRMLTINHPQMRSALWDLAYGENADYTAFVYGWVYDDLYGDLPPNLIVTNAFSINMLEGNGHDVRFTRVDDVELGELTAKYNLVSAIGHADTAALFSEMLNIDLKANRASLTFCEGEPLLVGAYKGQRLPEGAKSLPEGAVIEWWLVK